jgi:replicative DNA helicase
MVMFLYRPDYYDITTNDMGEDTKGDVYVKIAKHRNGSLENIKLKAKLHIQKFIESENIDSFSPGGSQGGSWRPVGESQSAKLFIQKGSRMNDEQGGDDDDAPF